MRKKKSHPVADQFSHHEMDGVKRYGQALDGSPTPFDEEVEFYAMRMPIAAAWAAAEASQTVSLSLTICCSSISSC
jgi:hypothetical protein